MGQDYRIVNVDTREMLALSNGKSNDKFNKKKIEGRLMELAYDKVVGNALLGMLAGAWKGNRVYVIGAYAGNASREAVYYAALSKAAEELGIEDNSLYTYADSCFALRCCEALGENCRFIYNHARRQYIDMNHCPISYFGKERWQDNCISPLILLLAMGNGFGSGGYWNRRNNALVGSWCDTASSIEITCKPLQNTAYKEFRPDFLEICRML